MIQIKRAYEPASEDDGYRILVDRLWPRGVSKKEAKLDDWAKDLAPSTELREAFGHKPEHWPEFHKRYLLELRSKEHQEWLKKILALSRHGTVTLVYGAHDPKLNNAAVLLEALEKKKKAA